MIKNLMWKMFKGLPLKYQLLIIAIMGVVGLATYNTIKWVALGAILISAIIGTNVLLTMFKKPKLE